MICPNKFFKSIRQNTCRFFFDPLAKYYSINESFLSFVARNWNAEAAEQMLREVCYRIYN